MAQRHTGRFIGALAALTLFLPLMTMAGCKLFNKEKKAFGEDCQSDTDCESVECATYGSVCTKACTYDRECGSGFVCRARDGRPGDACAKPTGVPNGQSCNTAAECQSGNCLKPVGQNDAVGFCSNHCEAETDCPDSYKLCMSISDSGATKFCLPGGGGSANIPGGPETPKFVAPRPVSTVKAPTTVTTTAATVATATAKPTSTGPGPVITTAMPTGTATASAAPTTTASTKPTATASATASTTIKKPPVIVIKKPK